MDNQFYNPNKVREQYKNDDNLNARINLHSFNTNKTDWNVWFFKKMDIPVSSRILELGCGNGLLWQRNEQAINKGWDITLSDFSDGILQSAKQNINNDNFKYKIFDIQDIPYEDESFDIIIARHMLYHVPDIDKALSEIRRVLKPNGKFYVSTNGKNHMQELKTLVKGYDASIDYNPEKFAIKFGLENGGEMLRKYFSNVTLEEFNGQDVVDKAEPVVSYVTSAIGVLKSMCDEGKLSDFIKYVEQQIRKSGALKISTETGMFTANKL